MLRDNFTRHLFDQSNVERMSNAGQLPVVFALTCYTNDFDNPHVYQTLGEIFVNSPNGAVAVIGAAERTFIDANRKYTKTFLGLLAERKFERLGDYFAEAKRLERSSRANGGYLLLGDPSLEWNMPRPEIGVQGVALGADGALSFEVVLPENMPTPATIECMLMKSDTVLAEQWSETVGASPATIRHPLTPAAARAAADMRQLVVYARDGVGNDYTGGAILPRARTDGNAE
jgi:hypothetical protein